MKVMTMRAFQGRASEELYNEDLLALYNSLKTLHEEQQPEDANDNALWIDANNVLKIQREGKFETLFDDTYQAMAETISTIQPTDPKPGQLWLNEGVLLFYNGIKWEAAKAAMVDDFTIDGFEPFLIIDSLPAGGNEIIKKQLDIIEEEFIASEGANEFILQKGQYEPMQNKIAVYVNGRILAKSKYLEHSPSAIRLIEPLHQEERLMCQYLSKNAAKRTDYVPLKFHPALREERFIIEEPTHYVMLSSDCLTGEENMMVYVNGRFVGNRYYVIEDQRTVRLIAELQPNEEVLIQYVDQLIQDTLPDGDIAVEESIPYSQYLWPNGNYDKLFMNGKLNQDYEMLNKITIQYPSSAVQGKLISAVHVHPRNLSDIQKRIYSIDKATGFVQVDELNTEFYAITKNTAITDADMMQSYLYPHVASQSMLTSESARSYVLNVQPNTEYRIKRSVLSSVFKITEHSQKPAVGTGYTQLIEVDAVEDVESTYTLTTGALTQFIVIHLDNEGGSWHTPVITTDYASTKTILLVKTQATDTDYISTVGGIFLSNYIMSSYDYILAVTYVFGETTGRGVLTKMSFDITDTSQIIVGHIHDPLLVFAQGHYLTEENNYYYDIDSGLLTLLFPEKIDVGVLTFPRYEGGYILEKSHDDYGIVVLQKNMIHPLVFIYGENLQQLADYTQDGNIIYVKDAEIDMSYAVVDCVDAYGDSMFVSEGTLSYDSDKQLYYVPTTLNFDHIKPILFINGLLINASDLFWEENKLYVYNRAETTMHYILLKDDKGRFIHSDIKEANTYALTATADQTLMYVDGNIVGDMEAFGVKHLPHTGYQREIKGTMYYDTRKGYLVEDWYMYVGNEWMLLDNEKKVTELNNLLCDYILENKAVHFNDISSIRNKRCTAWLYKYDESIEYPLLHHYYTMPYDTVQYETLPTHYYKLNQNALSVYIDGYRQYPEKINFPNGVKEIDGHHFEISQPIAGSMLDYIIELPENGEAKSCMSEVLTSDDVYNQTLKTSVPLLPGFIDLFIDGIRQPKESFEVVDRYSIVLHQFVKDPRYQNVFLLEVRHDYALKEATRVIERDGQTSFICADEMRSLMSSKDFIKIYVNGVYVADDYIIVREQALITIPRLDELGFNKKGHVVSFIWR